MIINFSNIGSGTGGGDSYTLPVASASVLGGVKIGSGINIDQDGVISAQSGKNDIVLDVAVLDNMSYADREVLWDEVYEKILAGHRIYAKGEVRGEMGYYAYLPLEKYKAETNTSAHIGGFLFFTLKDKDENLYLRFSFSSAGNLNGLDSDSRLLKYKIYSLPTASSNTLGGVKIGSGISIDEDGVISAQGGGGYNVVDSLPATGTATEDALYYLKAYVESVDYRGISISTTSSEGYVAHIYDGGGNEKSVYISGTNFHWGYQNDGEYHKKDDAEFWYKTNNANKTINVYLPDDSWTVTLEEGATSAETTPYTVQIPHDAQTYRFNGTGYTIAGGYDDIYFYFDYRDRDNAEKKQALANSISAVQPENRKNIRLFVSNLSSDYIRSLEGDPYILFMPTLDRQDGIFFTASIFPHNGGGAHDNPVFINCYVGFNGGFAFQMVQAPSLFVLNVDPVSHSLNNNGLGWMVIKRTASDDGRVRPIIQLSYNNTVFNAVYKGSMFDNGRIYLDAKHEGKNLHGVWEINDEYCNLVEWSENPDTYQSVSGLSNAGIDTASFENEWYSVPANVITSLTEETELFVNKMYDNKCKVTTDGTAIKMYGEDGAGGWVLRGSGTWADSSIGTTDIGNNPGIHDITTGSTTYQFRFVYNDYGDPGTTISKTPFYKPFEGLLAFDKSNSSLNLYAGGQWRTIYPQA